MKSLLLIPVLLLLAHCASIPTHVDPPRVELQSLRVEEPSLSAATFVFGLRVDNPNGFDLDLNSLDYRLKVNGQELSQGATRDEVSLPKNDRVFVDLPFRVPYTALFRSFEDLVTKKAVDYELSGVAFVHGQRVPFELKGMTDLPGGLRGPAD